MFANLMNLKEKENFLELVYKIASCDGIYADEEEALINNYKTELSISIIPDTKSMEDLIKSFSEKEEHLRKAVFFELYGMIVADGIVEENEKKIMEQLETEFSLDEESYSALIAAANGLQKAYDDVYAAIFD